MLVESYYDDAKAEETAASAREGLLQAVGNFLEAEDVVAIRRSLLACELHVEQRMSGLELDGFAIEGKVDALAFAGCDAWIMDWKMGLPRADQDSFQLFTYGWWASQKLSVEPARVHVRRVFLRDGTVEKDRTLDDGLVRRCKARLIQDIELMKELDHYGRDGKEAAFSPCTSPKVCRACKCQQVCPSSRSGLRLRPTSAAPPGGGLTSFRERVSLWGTRRCCKKGRLP